MKKLLAALVATLALSTACVSKTEYGHCIGILDGKDPALTYRLSGWNIAMGILFSELIVPPVIVIVDETFCPVGRK